MRSKAAALLDAAIVTAVLGFVGTVMLARYIEQSNLQDWESDEE
jgi:multisubunit Na+/H+ antiporter MnhF subunit